MATTIGLDYIEAGPTSYTFSGSATAINAALIGPTFTPEVDRLGAVMVATLEAVAE